MEVFGFEASKLLLVAIFLIFKSSSTGWCSQSLHTLGRAGAKMATDGGRDVGEGDSSDSGGIVVVAIVVVWWIVVVGGVASVVGGGGWWWLAVGGG